eukprot:4332083-Prymnesium_polylepis.1
MALEAIYALTIKLQKGTMVVAGKGMFCQMGGNRCDTRVTNVWQCVAIGSMGGNDWQWLAMAGWQWVAMAGK